jgi:biotin carboxyl carrier protein
MKHYQITVDDRTFDVKVLSDPQREQVEVEVDGEAFTVAVRSATAAVEAALIEPAPDASTVRAPTAVATASPGTLTSPLPGVIKSLAVRPGQKVATNDELLVIEAMKMDNVIRAQRAGTIGTIFVSEGRQVAYGEALLDYRE